MKHLMQKIVVLMEIGASALVAQGGNCPCDELRINEICYAPTEGGPQWVEIVNTGEEPVFPSGAELVGDTGALSLPDELGGIPGKGIVLVVFDGADASENRYECALGAAAVIHGPADGLFGNPVGFCGLYRVSGVHEPNTLLDFLAWGGEPGVAAADAVAKGVWNSESSYLVTGVGGEIGPYVGMQAGGSFARSGETFVGWSVLGPGDVTFGRENDSLAVPVLHYPPADVWSEKEPLYFSWFSVMNASGYDFQLADTEDFTNLLAEGNELAGGFFENEDGLGLANGVYYWRVRARNENGPSAWSETRKLEKGYYFLNPPAITEEDLPILEENSSLSARVLHGQKQEMPHLTFLVHLECLDDQGREQTKECDAGIILDAKDADGKPLSFDHSKLTLPAGQTVSISLKDNFKPYVEWWQNRDGSRNRPSRSYSFTVPDFDASTSLTISFKRKILSGFTSFGAQKDSKLLATGFSGETMCTRFDNANDQGWDCPHENCHHNSTINYVDANERIHYSETFTFQESWYCWAAALKMLCDYYGKPTPTSPLWTRDAIIHATKNKLGFAAENGANTTKGAEHVFDNHKSMKQEKNRIRMADVIKECIDANHPVIFSDPKHEMVISGYQWMMSKTGTPGFQILLNNTDNLGTPLWDYLDGRSVDWLHYPTEPLSVKKMPEKYWKDKDEDGVLDADEKRFGTDESNADTDGDGIPDKEEIASQEFPRKLNGEYNADIQRGGRIGAARLPTRTKDPAKTKDTDGGGVDDGAEDLNQDGMWDKDAGETDIFDKADDLQLDVVFCFDTTGSMWSMLSSVQGKATDLVNKYLNSKTKAPVRFAVVQYRDLQEDGEPPTTVLGFSSDGDAVKKAINSLSADGGGDKPEDVNDALMHCINLSGWRGGGVKRRILLMGDAPDNGRGTRWTTVLEACQRTETEVTRHGVRRKVARESFGPISIITFPVGHDPETLANFKEIAESTDGECIPVGSASDTGDAVMAALEAIETTPVVSLAVEGAWGAKHIVADATGTTDPRGCGIVKYEWDWEADGTYDEWSYKPVAEKDYPEGFQGKVRVRATSATGDKGTRTVIIVAPEFLDVTTMTDMTLASARLDPNTGAILCDITLGNKTDTVKTLKDKFWFVLPSTSTIFLANPSGTMEDGTPYVDITSVVEAALPSVGNGDLCLDPGETVVLKNAIAIYSYDRSIPTGFMFAVWADPPPEAVGSGSPGGGKTTKSIVGYKFDRQAEEVSLTLEDGSEMSYGLMYSTNLVDWSQTIVSPTSRVMFIRVGLPE